MLYTDALMYLGGLFLLSQALSLLSVLYKTLLRPGKNLKKYGEWAVVTGATDGIGKEMAFELARKGQSVFLMSRSEDKLTAVKDELAAKYPKVGVKTLAVDFSKFTAAQAAMVKKQLAGLEVGVLINNVGISYEFAQWFHELTDAEVQGLVSLNVESTTWMTRAVLPGMLARKSGAVVNMSSAAARAPLPLLAQYSASKGYIENFTRSLDAEYSGAPSPAPSGASLHSLHRHRPWRPERCVVPFVQPRASRSSASRRCGLRLR